MSETERNVAIDKVIDALKKQEKEEKRRLADQELAEQQGNSDFGRNNGNGYNSRNNRNQGNSNAHPASETEPWATAVSVTPIPGISIPNLP